MQAADLNFGLAQSVHPGLSLLRKLSDVVEGLGGLAVGGFAGGD